MTDPETYCSSRVLGNFFWDTLYLFILFQQTTKIIYFTVLGGDKKELCLLENTKGMHSTLLVNF